MQWWGGGFFFPQFSLFFKNVLVLKLNRNNIPVSHFAILCFYDNSVKKMWNTVSLIFWVYFLYWVYVDIPNDVQIFKGWYGFQLDVVYSLHLSYPENVNCQNQISFRYKVYLILFSVTRDFPFLGHKSLLNSSLLSFPVIWASMSAEASPWSKGNRFYYPVLKQHFIEQVYQFKLLNLIWMNYMI